MKTFNRIFLGLLVAFFFCGVAQLHASASVRSPKEIQAFGYTTTITSVTLTSYNSLLASTTTVPGAVYQLILSTGVASDYCVLMDTNNTVGLTYPLPTASATRNVPAQLGTKFFLGSTTANSIVTFDPPVLFFSGLMVECSSSSDAGSVTYELGRGLSGQ